MDYKKTEQAFIEAGVSHFHELYSQHAASPLFERLEKGELDRSQFYNELRKSSGVALTDEQVDKCWNSMLGRFYPEAIQVAKELRNQYRLFLFSNTNVIHYESFMRIYEQQFGRRDFDQLFEKAYYSHTSGVRKPYREAFEWVLNDAGIDAGNTLFIDDTYSNIEGAEKAGLQTLFLKPPMKLWEIDFQALGF